MYWFCLRFHWNSFLGFESSIFQHWFRHWWLVYWHIYASLGLNELIIRELIGDILTLIQTIQQNHYLPAIECHYHRNELKAAPVPLKIWTAFSEIRTMLLDWSSGCINSAISHQHWPHYTGSLSTAGLISILHCWFTKPSMVKPQPISQISCTREAALGRQATYFTATLSFEILSWPCVLLYSPSFMGQYPSKWKDCQDCW